VPAVVAAALHATWNLLLKRAADRNALIVLALFVSTLSILPLLAFRPAIGVTGWSVALVSGLLEVAYFVVSGEPIEHQEHRHLVVAYCRGPYCVLSFEAVVELRARGYRVRRLETGFPQWRAAGLPVETGPVAIRRRRREVVS
jgi:rhodanese-related sulfurtransferase